MRGWTEFTAAKLHYRVRLFASDAQEGLKEARKTVFPAVPWQRCHAHLQRNAQRYVPRQLLRDEVAADIRAIFNAPERADADALLQRLLVIRA